MLFTESHCSKLYFGFNFVDIYGMIIVVLSILSSCKLENNKNFVVPIMLVYIENVHNNWNFEDNIILFYVYFSDLYRVLFALNI